MSSYRTKTGFCVSGLGSLGTIFSTSMAMGCCAGLLAPVSLVAAAALPVVGASFQMPLLYSTVALTLIGLVRSYRCQRSPLYLIVGLLGAFLLLIPFHAALEVSLFYLLISLGLAGLLLGSWGDLIGGLFNVRT